jgi:uncharacterized protein (DUF433 family)
MTKQATILERLPFTFPVPLREDPQGVLRVGKTRVLLELVVHAYQQGESPEGIIEMYPALDLGDVFAVLAYYLANRAAMDEYLHQCDEEADALRAKIEASQRPRPSKEELMARARAKGLIS